MARHAKRKTKRAVEHDKETYREAKGALQEAYDKVRAKAEKLEHETSDAYRRMTEQ